MSKDKLAPKEVRVAKWYFGGLASAGAACITHPLDLLKVQMQTQKGKNVSLVRLIGIVVKNQGNSFKFALNHIIYSPKFPGIIMVIVTIKCLVIY